MRIELQDVRKSHMLANGGFVTLLSGIDLTLESGSSTILSGVSGSGKTTLLNIMGGLTRPTSGSVRLDGKMLPHGCCTHCGTISLAFQEPVFIPELTVLENLLLPAVRNKQSGLGQGENVLELFGLSEQFDLMPADLSGGEKRRLNLARALFPTPRLLLLDEPFAGLGREWEEKAMEQIVRQVRDTRATLVIATANQIPGGDGLRWVRMHKGKVITDGNSDY